MRVLRIFINNFLGIDELEIDAAGQFKVIEGANGTGKTSALKAIKAGTEGGHDATLIRQGEQTARVIFEFDDGSVLTKLIGHEDSQVQLRDPKLGNISAVMTRLKKLFDGSQVNPIAFIHADQKKRIQMFLEALPVELTDAEFARLSKDCASGNMAAMRKAHPVITLAMIYKDIYAQRKNVNVRIREKKDTVTQVLQSLPELPEVSFVDKAEALQANLTAAETGLITQAKDIEIRQANATADIQGQASEQRRTATSAVEAKILTLKDELAAKNREINLDEQNRVDAVWKKFNEEKLDLNSQMQPAITDYSSQLATARANIEIEIKAKGARELAEKMQKELNDLQGSSDKFTAVLEDIEAVKVRLLSNVPIPGVEVREDDIYVKGIPFSTINESQQMHIGFQVAKLRTPECPLMLVDGIERLDPANQMEFEALAKASNIFTIVTKVGAENEPLTVKNTLAVTIENV
jgi:DNA repair exonuclease SbcCD ATPase subunit